MEFGIMFFASSEDSLTSNIYNLVKECAVYGDQNGFSSVWVPERHFTEFGGAYNNPAVLQAALSSITSNIRLNSGSVVMALHDPIRVAEEWAMVDNLSGGRAGLAIASGWNPDDFAFFPANYKNKHDVMHRNLSIVRKLWKGETIDRLSGNGKMSSIRIYPSLVQEEITLYLTISGNPEGFKKAGELGINILTSVLDQTVEELAEKIKIYRQARLENGFDPKTGKVSLMLHTYIGENDEQAKEEAREPYCSFLKRNRKLFEGLAHNRDRSFSLSALEEDELDDFVDFLYDRFTNTKGLIGDKESCDALIREVMEAEVDEVVCLLDFGPPAEKIVENLKNIKKLKDAYQTVEV